MTDPLDITTCDHCSSKRAVQGVSAGSEIAFHNVTGTGELEWYSFLYHVSDSETGQVQIRINDESNPTNLSDLNSRAGRHHIVPVRLRLDAGDVNTIRFGAVGAAGTQLHDHTDHISIPCVVSLQIFLIDD